MSSRPTPGVASARTGPERIESADGAAITPVGVDVGSRQLVTVATASDDVDEAITVSGVYAECVYSEFCSATQRLDTAPEFDDTALGEVVARYWDLFRATFEHAADEAISYARQHPAPVLVLEDLKQKPRPLRDCAHGNLRFGSWCPAVVQEVLADRALDAGVPVIFVPPEYTSQECHRCGEIGELENKTLTCTVPGCPVDDVDRDRSAAVSIAKRV